MEILLQFIQKGDTHGFFYNMKLNQENWKDKNGDILLHHAIKFGRLKMVEYLIKFGKADVHAKNENGNTSLHIAVQYNSEEIIDFLISYGAAVDIVNNYGKTPLQLARDNKCPVTFFFIDKLYRGKLEYKKIFFNWESYNSSYSTVFKAENDDMQAKLEGFPSNLCLILMTLNKSNIMGKYSIFVKDRHDSKIYEGTFYSKPCGQDVMQHYLNTRCISTCKTYGYNNNSSNITVSLIYNYDDVNFSRITTNNAKKLDSDLKTIVGSDAFSDIKIMLDDGTTIPAHRNILAARSAVLASMFDNEKGTISVGDIKDIVVKKMLEFIYTGQIDTFEDIAIDLLKAADKYALEDLKEICEETLLSTLSVDNAVMMLLIADCHSAMKLKDMTLHFIMSNACSIVTTNGWKDLVNASLVEEAFQMIVHRYGQIKILNPANCFSVAVESQRPLANGLEKLLNSSKFSDMKIIGNGFEMLVHKNIFSARSTVFAALLDNGVKEQETIIVIIDDIEENVIKKMVKFIYTDEIDNFDEMAVELLVAAEKYSLIKLKGISEGVLIKQFSIENISFLLTVADHNSAMNLKKEALNFIADNATSVLKTSGWNDILMSHPKLINEAFAILATDDWERDIQITGKKLRIISKIKRPLLGGDLKELMTSGKFSDVTIIVEEKVEILAHRNILAARSSVFDAMYNHNLEENKTSRVNIVDVKENVVKKMLDFIYTDIIDNFDEMALELLIAADKYALEDLKNICENKLICNLSVENVVESLVIADLHSALKLKPVALRFIVQHAYSVPKTSDWKELVNSQPRLIKEVFEIYVSCFEEYKEVFMTAVNI